MDENLEQLTYLQIIVCLSLALAQLVMLYFSALKEAAKGCMVAVIHSYKLLLYLDTSCPVGLDTSSRILKVNHVVIAISRI